MLYTIILVVHIIVSLFLILIVLLQAGKGGGMGAAFGGGGSGSVFGGRGAGDFLSRLTTVMAAAFMILSIILARYSLEDTLTDAPGLPTVEEPTAPTSDEATVPPKGLAPVAPLPGAEPPKGEPGETVPLPPATGLREGAAPEPAPAPAPTPAPTPEAAPTPPPEAPAEGTPGAP
jgi:preprotein translocase subunit SecG